MPLDQTGLTSIEARNLLDSAGPNAVADVAQHPARRALRKLWASFREGVPRPVWMRTLALSGTLMAPLPAAMLAGVGVAAVVFALVLDMAEVLLFRVLSIA